MNNPSRTSDKILPRPNPRWRNSTDMLIWAIIVLQLLIALFAYPFLPATVPIHWSGGHANSYGPKWMATFLFPGISLLVWFLRVRQAAGPHLGSRIDEATNVQWRSLLFMGSIVVLLLVQVIATANNLGMNLDISFFISLGVGGLLIFTGNYLGKLRRNFWMGIRTPWTLSSDASWERTHRVGGRLFVACGLLCIPLSFMPALRPWFFLSLVLLMAAFLYLYSYISYRREQSEYASGPFDDPPAEN
ncbi:immunity protein SdpI [Ktedonobacter sp. SOSP1-52]|uniref:SdpI family protein n=1 Tax=Ktedonobacter sp. SOSP1-52 TaxID=2778366 RepID=UPI001915A28D|nr:SdpI family protein [Ktedonobacter sp. SOSP1-52]GHO70796.1 immunity protein SdpI [Ktedonobacter sp. SOSP1-52]